MTRNGIPYARLIEQPRKRQPISQLFKAIIRDYSALWREFRLPIVCFLVATIGLGLIYGELHEIAYPDEDIPVIDRPYVMLQLMVLESPDLTVPREPHLILFWYLLPVLFVYIVAQGASDFVRVFFSPDERRSAWMEAIASTYRNHVIVFGAGHVGLRVVVQLAQMGCEVIVIDNDPDADVDEILQKLRVPLIVADGRTTNALERAALPHAASFIACTSNDHNNLEAIMKARELNPKIRIIARVWDDQFASQIKKFMNVQTVLSSSDIAAPVFAGAALGVEITQTLNINGVDYSMIRVEVAHGSFLQGQTIGDLQQKENIDVVLCEHDSAVDVQPAHNITVRAGDTLVVFARHTQILSIVARNRPSGKR
ncbi:MAG: hypothetical protein GFH27_549411n47 [Chloroflexi bacterium AL-W]|nr:hypothetical protein [Chloroflexi bacterium AL-W]